MTNFSKNIIKKHDHWTVSVHINQEYLGRCVIWCNREDAHDLSDATTEELIEFSKIIKKLKIAIEKSFNSDWMNYSFLGNDAEFRHLHCHMVPRYETERTFNNQIFKDPRWGYNWLLNENFITSEEMLQCIKKKIQSNYT